MKRLLRPNHLPIVTAGLGGIALVLRRLLYLFAMDEKGLLVSGHPLEFALIAVTGIALGYILITVWKLDGSNDYADNFRASIPAAVGHVLTASGMAVTVLFNGPVMQGYLGTAWRVLGFAAPVCLLLAGFARMGGRKPFFLLHLVPTVFLMVHIINHYQVWCGNPQLQDYVYTLFGTMALTLFAFYHAAFSVGLGKRRMQMGTGLAAAYLCMAELAVSQYPYLYLGCIVWALTDLCSPYPQPKQAEEA